MRPAVKEGLCARSTGLVISKSLDPPYPGPTTYHRQFCICGPDGTSCGAHALWTDRRRPWDHRRLGPVRFSVFLPCSLNWAFSFHLPGYCARFNLRASGQLGSLEGGTIYGEVQERSVKPSSTDDFAGSSVTAPRAPRRGRCVLYIQGCGVSAELAPASA